MCFQSELGLELQSEQNIHCLILTGIRPYKYANLIFLFNEIYSLSKKSCINFIL